MCAPLTKIVGRLRLFSTPLMKLPTVLGSAHFLCTPLTKPGGRLRLCAPPMMKMADGLRLYAPPSRELWDVSGCLHPHDENCRQAQALCTLPHHKRGAFQALCTPMMKIADRLRLCAPRSCNLWGVSGCVRPHHKIADSLRLWALSVLSNQLWGV